MKSLAKGALASFLALLARGVLAKYRPRIIMVTGSVGKTSTKDAVAAMLAAHTEVRASEKSYNSEFGVPFTIFGVHNPWTNPIAWFDVIGEALALIVFPHWYPKTLVLEVGADRPGDLARILRIATPDAVIVTRLPEVPVHVEAYATPEAVRQEEFAPAYALPSGAPLILSSRDSHAIELARGTLAQVTLFGFSLEADVHLAQPSLEMKGDVPVGMIALAHVHGKEYALHATGALGRPQVLAPAAALALAYAMKLPLAKSVEGLKHYRPPAGRGRLLEGTQHSLLIDESYNASPAAVEESLHALSLLPKKGRHIAVLGDMLELGRYSRSEHERIGALVPTHADVLIAVGPRSKVMAETAVASGLSESQVNWFATAAEAAEYLRANVREGDAILIKGSQSIRLERVVEALLADPTDAKYLVRQERQWKQKK